MDDFQDFDSLSQHFGRINTDESGSSHSVDKEPFRYVLQLTDEQRKERIERQRRESKWHQFVEGNLILKMGLIDKRKVSCKRRLKEDFHLILNLVRNEIFIVENL